MNFFFKLIDKKLDKKCDTLLEYMCGENVRDGSTTKTIPLDQDDCEDKNCTTDSEYGMHEDYMHYYQCKNRERNHRLFTSTHKLKVRVFYSL